jgi:hypothetical protein
LRHLETREGQTRSDLIFPEKAHDVGPVELVCRLGARQYAFEHTRIEPFAGHIQLGAEAERHFDPLADLLAGKLPADDKFELHVPVGVLLGKHDREVRPIQEALVTWISSVAPTLPIAAFGRYALPNLKVTPPGVPFAVSLHRWKREEFPFPFIVKHAADFDIEAARRERLKTAYQKKLGKLLRWKQAGARAILILEEDDNQSTNHFRVAEALRSIEALVTDRPDEIYLFSTAESRWFAVRLRIGDILMENMELEERYWEAGPEGLEDITGNG